MVACEALMDGSTKTLVTFWNEWIATALDQCHYMDFLYLKSQQNQCLEYHWRKMKNESNEVWINALFRD